VGNFIENKVTLLMSDAEIALTKLEKFNQKNDQIQDVKKEIAQKIPDGGHSVRPGDDACLGEFSFVRAVPPRPMVASSSGAHFYPHLTFLIGL